MAFPKEARYHVSLQELEETRHYFSVVIGITVKLWLQNAMFMPHTIPKITGIKNKERPLGCGKDDVSDLEMPKKT
jgi:hypothetical protein